MLSGTYAIDVDAAECVDLGIDANVADPRLNAMLKQRGMRSLRKVQAVALQHGLLAGQSMLVVSPSGSGKTLIGELAAVNAILQGNGKAVYLVPLKALASEKHQQFETTLAPLGITVALSIGDLDQPPDIMASADLVVMTYEKLDSMLRVARGVLAKTCGCLVIDEFHVMGEAERGPRLESLVMRAAGALGHVQVIALSATIANPVQVNDWLRSSGHESMLLLSRERPVPLAHEIPVVHDNVDAIITILNRVAADGGQCLIFTRSRGRAELLAQQLASTCARFVSLPSHEALVSLASDVKRVTRYSNLPPLLARGIAYHHAGLAAQERDAVEKAFTSRYLVAACCTTTLAAGINLPARVVIIEDYKQVSRTTSHGGSSTIEFTPMSRNTLHQIAGRAGRPGFDETGTAFIFTHSRAEARWIKHHYFTGHGNALEAIYDPLRSSLADRDVVLEQLLVFIHEAQPVPYRDIIKFFARSFYHYMLPDGDIPVDVLLKIKRVVAEDLRYRETGGNLRVTMVHEATRHRVRAVIEDRFGTRRWDCYLAAGGEHGCTCGAMQAPCEHLRCMITVVLAIDPGLEPAIDGMLAAAFKDECLIDYLIDHGFIEQSDDGTYQCLPFGSLVACLYITPAIGVFITRWLATHVAGEEILAAVEPCFSIMMHVTREGQDTSRVAGLLAAAWHWMEEEPMDVVLEPCRKPVPALPGSPVPDGLMYLGDVTSTIDDLQRWARVIGAIAGFAGAALVEPACTILERRLKHGVKADLLQLMESIQGIDRAHARALFNAGYTTIDAVQEASVASLAMASGLPAQACASIITSARDRVPVPEFLIVRDDGTNSFHQDET